MRLFLQLNITDWKEESFDKPFLSFASSLADDIIGTDLDSQSDAYVADLVIKLISQADAVFLLVIAKQGMPLGVANSMLNNLLKINKKIEQAVLYGHHDYAEKLLATFKDRFKKTDNEDDVRKLIQAFAGPASNSRLSEN
jgi:hypothetical protein